ncbi:MAG: bifunctional (p)ppGpp synthetase/guanosine-3',5'-bis(diphosphate) 3'-pyrophosphohydrolase [Desulfobacterales bacterium]|jgi:GTP pyrophosphokinase|nr:bifunctional (p)ppGpp synthetase/guanosine-3',5'-bis(diphosphate) 3'-pyrophosphohydrolase [Desulfobacterales bacterium]
MLRFNDILDRLGSYNPNADTDLLKKAYVFSAKVHLGQVRLSGEPYLTHPLEVTGILTQMQLDAATLATGLLHDTVEDTLATLEEIRENFGNEISQLVDGVTKISRISLRSSEESQAENFRKMILAMVKDIRVVLIKLADRLHNMQTLKYHTPEKQAEIAQETLDIYAPLANRLGIDWIKTELEDLAFKHRYPDIYGEIQRKIVKKERERHRYIDEMKRTLMKKLYESKIEGEVTGRLKQIYSIYLKMKDQNIDFDQVYDITAFRIVVHSIKDCYDVLGIIHSLWKPIPGKFKDYIGLPKENLYQSLHTAAIGPYGERIEIQIRTQEMHRIAEEGIAAHWKYKEGKPLDEADDKRFTWLRQLLEWQHDLKDDQEFIESVKVDLFPHEVYIFTPKGEVKEFPTGATPVDFAYSIHSDIGNHCVGAKVNRKIVPLKYEFKSGDTVEILTSPNQKPSKDWLKFVKTPRAKTKIRQWFKSEEREKSIALGKEILDKELRKYDLHQTKLMKSGELAKVAGEFSFQAAEDLIAAVGYGKVTANQIIGKLLPPERLEQKEEQEESRLKSLLHKITRTGPKDALLIKGIDNVMVRYAGCCNPVPGDRVVGFITRGRGVSIHTVDCQSVVDEDPNRKVEVEWDSTKGYSYPARIRIYSDDKKGLLAEISSCIASNEANITNARVETTDDRRAIGTFELQIRDLNHLKKVIKGLEKIKGVHRVERMRIELQAES